MNLASEFVERYHDDLQNNCPDPDSDSLSRVTSSLEITCWCVGSFSENFKWGGAIVWRSKLGNLEIGAVRVP